jgi:pimeloyl-ACP methyl ester carboxylesterase
MRTFLSFLSTAIILFACSNPEEKKDEGKTGAQQSGQDQKTNSNVTINNVAIEYDECGKGDTTLLFVHGWCINKEYWDDQKKYFCDKYKVVTLDLPGFGRSGKNRTIWTFEQYTDDIYEFIKEKKLKNVILVGHSMSGDILLLMDTRYPESIIGMVGIDNLKKPGTKNTEEQAKEMEGFFAMMDSSFSGTVEMYTKKYLFPPSADTSIVNRVIKDFKTNDSMIAIKVLRSLVDISQRERDMMQQLKHKLYLVNSDVGPTEIDSLKKYCKASAEVVYIKGTGHYPMIEKPAEFNAALEKVIGMIQEKQ